MDDTTRPTYVNVFEVRTGPFDFVLRFGYKGRAGDEPEWLGELTMSPTHAKTVYQLLGRLLDKYEEGVGSVPTPEIELEESQ